MQLPAIHITPEEKKRFEALVRDLAIDGKDHGFHILVKDVLALCTNDEGLPWTDKIVDDDVAVVKELVARASLEADAKRAVGDLLRFTLWLAQDPKAKVPAAQLADVVVGAAAKLNLISHRGNDGAFDVDATKQGRAQATGKSESVHAPKLGDKAPEGSLRRDRIAPKRRI